MALFPDFYSQPKTDRRRAVVNGRKKTSWQVTDVWDRHHEIRRRIFLGQKNTAIAEALNISTQSVSQVRNSEVVQRQLQQMQSVADDQVVDIRSEIRKLAPKAVQVLGQLLESDSTPANVRLNAVRDVLDRDGHKPVEQVQHLHGHFNAQDLAEIKARALGLARESGMLVELEPESESGSLLPPSVQENEPEPKPKPKTLNSSALELLLEV